MVTYPDGLKVYKFVNGQVEKVYLDNTRKIIFPNGDEKIFKEDEIRVIMTQ